MVEALTPGDATSPGGPTSSFQKMFMQLNRVYDEVKEQVTKRMGSGMQTNLISSAAAGFMCALTSLPFDLMKSRMMNMSPAPTTGKLPYSGLVDCATKIVTKEGPLALWRGYLVYYTRCAPNAMVCLLSVEQLNKMYKKAFLEPASSEQ